MNKTKFSKGNSYHVFNRGCNKEKIFFNEGNYIYLTQKIMKTYEKYKVQIISYCLMPNHYHFLVKQDSDIPISEWIRVMFIGYVQAVNIQQNRSGTLFEGRAKHILVDKQNYLIHLSRYIHLNPVKAGLVSTPDDWKYSNFLECTGKRDGFLYDEDFILNNFGSKNEYNTYVNASVSNNIEEKLEKYLVD